MGVKCKGPVSLAHKGAADVSVIWYRYEHMFF